jgi:hypothetical protein
MGFKLIIDPFLKYIELGLGIGCLCFFIHSFFDTGFYSIKLSSLLWIMMGAAMTLAHGKGFSTKHVYSDKTRGRL